MTTRQVLAFLLLAGICLVWVDRPLALYINAHKEDSLALARFLFKKIEFLGDSATYLVPSGVFLLALRLHGKRYRFLDCFAMLAMTKHQRSRVIASIAKQSRKTPTQDALDAENIHKKTILQKINVEYKKLAICLFVAVAATGLLVNIPKYIFARARPRLLFLDDTYGFMFFKGGHDYTSFPSGHTTTAVTAAVVLAAFFPKGRMVFYSIAALVGIERVLLGSHFPSDVLAGVVFGALGALYCLKKLQMK